MSIKLKSVPILLLAVSGCASVPEGPSVMVLPGNGLSFEQFRNDDAVCRQFAFFQSGGVDSNSAGMSSGVTSAVVGTALGAAAGAAFGGGRGAVIGAGSGLLLGSVVGSGAAGDSQSAAQQAYDNGYVQCMYAKGHQVPMDGQIMQAPRSAAPVADDIPPPPPGLPPPPPVR
ncbi:YMGG-like glycine zipper-containing protein [Methylovulum psychrotolerans]|uniref:YMGG-like Gly-zipper domain-containing protein n=1 Tax=Methylovulum psychrotolerans TaxID=1704499 RepID=A0A1Z4BYX3_9GAMM|nr:YMGG-like glycine zipper-containing protein [Methylovulum psychrotolerans]ASF46460.1 hypothetical protein CEK71_10440 [Methylovulum psychrotolerans]POZ53743.1 hypothetical protein AADEFJLK_00784 [Methylovulum psychrotolerans]